MVAANCDAFSLAFTFIFQSPPPWECLLLIMAHFGDWTATFFSNGMVQLKEKRLAMSGQARIHSTTNRTALPSEYNGRIVTAQLSPGKYRDWIHCLSSTSREGRNKNSIEVIHWTLPRPTGKKTLPLSRQQCIFPESLSEKMYSFFIESAYPGRYIFYMRKCTCVTTDKSFVVFNGYTVTIFIN